MQVSIAGLFLPEMLLFLDNTVFIMILVVCLAVVCLGCYWITPVYTDEELK